EFEIDGCTDVIACNYDSGATNDGVDCIYTEEFYDCDGNCLNDSNNNNLCDEFEVYGCTIESADNFDPEALIDNGTCQWYDGLVNSLSYEVYSYDGVEGTTTYRLFANFSTVDIEVVGVYGNNAVPWQLIPSTSFYQDASGTPLASGIDTADFSEFPSLEFDTWLALGAAPGEPDGINTAGMDALYPSFEAGGALNVNTFLGASIFVIPGQSSQSIPINGKVLLAQVTTDGFTDVLLNLALRNSDNESIEVEGMTLTFPCLVDSDGDGICDSDELLGCSIDSADNYNPFATENDGSCEISGCLTSIACNYNPIATYDDGSCIFYCPGCTDEVACNYDSGALQEDGSCEYPFDLYGFDYVDCEGQCLSDEDGDGVCLEDEIYGCTEIEACNFNGEATENDGSCEFQSCAGCINEEACNFDPEATLGDVSCEYESCAGCMYEFACNYDPEATIADNGSCEFGTCPGCTDPEACNYNPTITEDDGSCLYIDECGVCGGFGFAEGTCDCEGSIAESGYNCDGSCVIDTDADGICDEFEITGCMDIEAENYDETATDDDGSCLMGWTQLGQDIDGEMGGGQSGLSVSLSSDGTTVAIGVFDNDDNGFDSGHVRIYAWNSTTSTWEQQGADIDGEAAYDYSGESVSLSSDGTVVAIGAPGNDENGDFSGHTRIYAWDGSSWNQLGGDIDGETTNAFAGLRVSLSSDGTVVAIGSTTENFDSRSRIYEWDGSSWNQFGGDIISEGLYENPSLSPDGTVVAINGQGISRIYEWDGSSWNQFGGDIISEGTISLSSDGTVVAIAAASGNNYEGVTRIYVWNSATSAWDQQGADIDGEAEGDQSGCSVSLSSDGTTVAIGAVFADGNGVDSGYTRTYSWDGSSWNQFGGDIDGEAAGDNSGYDVSLSSDGTVVAIGALGGGQTRIYSNN
ncbi:hypothetical protein N9L13_08290, partial [Flavobacteriales bacterium]|nr:hypothetical protein [Flavobacteriales bacterium]